MSLGESRQKSGGTFVAALDGLNNYYISNVVIAGGQGARHVRSVQGYEAVPHQEAQDTAAQT